MGKVNKVNKRIKDSSSTAIALVESKWFTVFSILWFAFQTSYIALTSYYRIAPDAHTHLKIIELYAKQGLLPFITDQTGYHFLPELTRHPSTLYHYLMSFVYRLSPFAEEGTILLLRFTNIAIAVLSLYVFYKLMKRLNIGKFATNLTLFMLTNTLMFVYMSSSINYDNMAVLMALSSFYFLVAFMQTYTAKSLFALLIALTISSLVKHTLAPFIAPIFLVAAFYTYHQRKKLTRDIKSNISRKNKAFMVLGVLMVMVGFLFTERYIVNITQYGSVRPNCTEIKSLKFCKQNAPFARNFEYSQKNIELTLRPVEFTFKWSERMRASTFTIVSHKSFSETKLIRYGSLLLIMFMAVAVLRMYNRKEREINTILFISVYYVFVLLLVNYFQAYRLSGEFGIALQGRYAFPVLPVLFMLGNYYVVKLLYKNNLLKLLYTIFVIGIFIPSGLIWYIYTTGPEWREGATLEGFHNMVRSFVRNIINNSPLHKLL